MQYLLEMFGISLVLTWLLELPVGYCLGMRGGRNVLLQLLVNLLTNPAAVLLCYLGVPQLPVEVLVVVVEAAVYSWFSRDENWNIPRPVLIALTANGISWLTGALIQTIRG